MASITTDRNRICSIPSPKVRIIAKIQGFTEHKFESRNEDSTPRISVQKPEEDSSGGVTTISFDDKSTGRKEAYAVDYCYEQNEDRSFIFSREVKPLILGVFEGHNASVIAYGARGSGKTYTIQGSEETPGLAALAIAEILPMAKERGKLVSISLYEIFQDHVYDLLDPKQPEVHVLEDAQGKIKLKGLSHVSVNSIPEFHRLYFTGCSSHKSVQRVALEMPRRSHRGLIIHIGSNDENSNTKHVSKMNFVDLAGYEDPRRKITDNINLVEITRINKSLYALLNVVYALNVNENRVPFRESKLTRMLQDSFGGKNDVLMLTCLNPSLSQDTIYTTSLAARSCQGVNRTSTGSTKKIKGESQPMVHSSLKKGKLDTVSSTAKKQTGSQVHFSVKNGNCMVKGRKLFDEGNHLISSKQAKSPPNIASAMQTSFLSIEPSLKDVEQSISDVSSVALCQEVEETISDVSSATISKEEDVSLPCHQLEVAPSFNDNAETFNSAEDVDSIDKENKSLLDEGNKSLVVNEGRSPPISARLRELSNNLKLLYSSTPLHLKMPQEISTPTTSQVVSTDIVEPKTPVLEQNPKIYDKSEAAKFSTPMERFSARSSGVKHSLVQEYLNFLNSASKEELKGVKGIGEKRATYILQLREESPAPFKKLDDLKDIGLSAKQIKGMMKKVAGELF